MWRGPINQPDEIELRRNGQQSLEAFILQGRKISELIAGRFDALGIGAGARVLDFGAGVGRVAMPLHEATGLPSDACDINAAAMTYLAGQLPQVDCRTTAFTPDLPYGDDTFDAVYAIAVWSFLPHDAGLAWLQEIKRVLKPDGVALISTSGVRAVEVRRDIGLAGWSALSVADLKQAGVLFKAFPNAEAGGAYPGVTSHYGLSARHPDHIRAEWAAVMSVEDIEPAAVDGVQDLVVLRNTERAKPARKPRTESKSRKAKTARSGKTTASRKKR